MPKAASEGFTALPPERSSPENIFDLISIEGAASGTQLPPMPDVTPLEIKVQPADNIFAPASPKNPPPKNATREAKPALFLRVLGFTARVISLVFLGLLAWAAGAIYARQHLPADLAKLNQASQVQQAPQAQQVPQVQQAVQQSAPSDQMVGAMQQMTEQIRGLEAIVNKGGGAAQETASNAQTSSGAAIADLASRVDKLQTDLTTKLSQINEQLAHIEQQVSAPRPALTAREHPPRKRPEHYHDAFDPSRDPTAPGAPHPIGAQ